jgi:putative membrane protein insertion efficiency factor
LSFLWETLIGLPTWLLIFAIRIYQVTLSPIVGRQCRFTPTCSNYMIQAVLKHGLLLGVLKGIWRILRCNPFCRGGHDPP